MHIVKHSTRRKSAKTTRSFPLALAVFLFAIAPPALGQAPPQYAVDPSWPKPLPNNWIMGQVGGLTVDRENHIWVLQRPASDTVDELGAAQNPPRSECCVAAPPILVFDTQGNLLRSLGGPGQGYDWPTSEHGIHIDTERKYLDRRKCSGRPASDQVRPGRKIPDANRPPRTRHATGRQRKPRSTGPAFRNCSGR